MTLALNLLHGVGIWLSIVNNICKSWQSTLENMGQAWCSIKVLLEAPQGATVAPSHFFVSVEAKINKELACCRKWKLAKVSVVQIQAVGHGGSAEPIMHALPPSLGSSKEA